MPVAEYQIEVHGLGQVPEDKGRGRTTVATQYTVTGLKPGEYDVRVSCFFHICYDEINGFVQISVSQVRAKFATGATNVWETLRAAVGGGGGGGAGGARGERVEAEDKVR